MQRTDGGVLQLDLNEPVSVTVKATVLPFAATFSPALGSTWSGSQQPDALTQVNTFAAPSTPQASVDVTLVFDFVPDSTGAYPAATKYSVVVQGSSGSAIEDEVVPPPIASITFRFETKP
jgi:hypothetical protein